MVGTKRVRSTKTNGKAIKKIKTFVVPLGRIPRQLSMLGAKVKTKLRYVETFTIDPPTAGLPGTYVFSANGLYDPNITGVGHQPRGFDQIMALYDHYYTHSAKITVDYGSTSNGNVAPWCGGIVLDDNSTPAANMIQECEQRAANYRLSTDDNQPRITLGFNSKEWFSRFKESLLGTSGTNPSDQAYFIVFCQAVGTADLGKIDCIATIEYDVTFSEPKNVASS